MKVITAAAAPPQVPDPMAQDLRLAVGGIVKAARAVICLVRDPLYCLSMTKWTMMKVN
jgi:hypothetical protein